MKKVLVVLIVVMSVLSCKKSEVNVKEIVLDDYEIVTFKDKVSETGMPIEGAIVSLYASSKRYFGSTDQSGAYSIIVPTDSLLVDGYISLSISHPDYKPLNITYQAPLITDSVYDSKNMSSKMKKCPACLQVLHENYSELYHLGDDYFFGTINSQFQKHSDGEEIIFNFTNSSDASKLRFNFEAKGIQPSSYTTPSMIIFGDQSVVLPGSPEDGSYAQYSIEIENDPDIEAVKFKTSEPRLDGDVDDWEFTAFHIEVID